MSTILLTGANSFVGSHIIDALIKLNRKVVGTVRSAAAANDIYSFHPEWKDSLEVVVVEDITKERVWDELFKKNKFDHVTSPSRYPASMGSNAFNRLCMSLRLFWTIRRIPTTINTF